MPKYLVQKRIHTLLEYAIFEEGSLHPFTRNSVCFSSWEKDTASAWKCPFWLAESEIESGDFMEAWKLFQEYLAKITSRIAFVGQAYYTDLGQPYLILKKDSDIAYFRHSRDLPPVPLMFNEHEVSSLDALLDDAQVPDAFYLYWNDAINAFGYSSKLLLMFAALESLLQKASSNNSQYYKAIESIFGPDLKKELYGTPEDKGKSGLRQRLVHGEYLSEKDTKNYVEIINRHIVKHFNASILRGRVINENIVRPLRHPYGNMEGWQGYIRSQVGASLSLKAVLEAFDADPDNPKGYEILGPDDRPSTY